MCAFARWMLQLMCVLFVSWIRVCRFCVQLLCLVAALLLAPLCLTLHLLAACILVAQIAGDIVTDQLLLLLVCLRVFWQLSVWAQGLGATSLRSRQEAYR